MPRLSRWFVRLALGYLLLGSALGGVMLVAKAGVAVPAPVWAIWRVHGEMMLFGWVLQLAVGVGYWILPRHATAPVRGGLGAPLATLVGLNAGVLLTAAGSVVGMMPLTLAGRGVEMVAVAAFLLHAWPRVRRAARA